MSFKTKKYQNLFAFCFHNKFFCSATERVTTSRVWMARERKVEREEIACSHAQHNFPQLVPSHSLAKPLTHATPKQNRHNDVQRDFLATSQNRRERDENKSS